MKLALFGSTTIIGKYPMIKVADNNSVSLIIESIEFKPIRIPYLQLATFLQAVQHEAILTKMRRLN